MFELKIAIANWRRKMTAAGIKSRDVLDELESHLREDVDQQMRSGVTAERAFREAVRRVGAGDQLKQEFGKISVTQPQFSRRKMRVGCLAMAVFVFAVETWTLIIYDVTPTERFLGVALVSIIACYIGALPNLNRLVQPGVRGWTLRNAVCIACSWAGCIWVCLLFLSLVNINVLPDGIVLNVVCWALVAASAFTAVVIAHGTESGKLDLWSPTAWKSFELAEIEATRFHHDFIGTEHVLLGLLGEESNSVSNALRKMGVQRETIRAEIERIVVGAPQLHSNREPVCTPRAKKALQLAIQEAKAAGQNRVQPEHIFLGLLREGGGVAAKVLKALGVNAAIAREEIRKISNTSE
jgi:hypothetical protein